jgi:hypothetical protein
MPTSKTFSLVRGRRIRVTKTDACGDPVLGPTSVVVSEGFISVGLTANQEEGETISVATSASLTSPRRSSSTTASRSRSVASTRTSSTS